MEKQSFKQGYLMQVIKKLIKKYHGRVHTGWTFLDGNSVIVQWNIAIDWREEIEMTLKKELIVPLLA